MVYDAKVVDALLNKMAAIVDRIAELNRSIPEPDTHKTLH